MNAATIRYLREDLDEELPLPELPEPAAKARPRPAVLVSGRPARVLLAEDDPEMRVLLVSYLRNVGYEVVEAPNGKALLEEIYMLLFGGEAVPVDLIVSDERMPGLLGSEVLAGLREAKWPTPFILITGFGSRDLHERAYRMGAAAVFDKPFDLEELRDKMDSLLSDPIGPRT